MQRTTFLYLIILFLLALITYLLIQHSRYKQEVISLAELDLPEAFHEQFKSESIGPEAQTSKEWLKESLEGIIALYYYPGNIVSYEIPVPQARALNDNYVNNVIDPNGIISDSTEAVYFSLPKIFQTIKTKYGDRALGSNALLSAGFYAYFGRHAGGSAYPYQSTIMIHCSEDRSKTHQDTMVYGEIYDFGGLCPPRCPSNDFIR